MERNRRDNPVQRHSGRSFVAQFLEKRPCVQCGETDPVVLQFHHRDPGTKSGNVSDMVHARVSVGRLRIELAKCEVLCANCHQRLTASALPVHYKFRTLGDTEAAFGSWWQAANQRQIEVVLQLLRRFSAHRLRR